MAKVGHDVIMSSKGRCGKRCHGRTLDRVAGGPGTRVPSEAGEKLHLPQGERLPHYQM